jgi:hypothetical protein
MMSCPGTDTARQVRVVVLGDEMKAHRRMEVEIHEFITSVVDRGE